MVNKSTYFALPKIRHFVLTRTANQPARFDTNRWHDNFQIHHGMKILGVAILHNTTAWKYNSSVKVLRDSKLGISLYSLARSFSFSHCHRLCHRIRWMVTTIFSIRAKIEQSSCVKRSEGRRNEWKDTSSSRKKRTYEKCYVWNDATEISQQDRIRKIL